MNSLSKAVDRLSISQSRNPPSCRIIWRAANGSCVREAITPLYHIISIPLMHHLSYSQLLTHHYMLHRLKACLNDGARTMSITLNQLIHAIKTPSPHHSPTSLHPEVAIKQCIAKTLVCSPRYKYLSPPRLIQPPFFFPHASGRYHQASVPAAHE